MIKNGGYTFGGKYTLNVEEASLYFGIGQKRLYSIIHKNYNAEFLLTVGNHIRIKRRKFEEYIDNADIL